MKILVKNISTVVSNAELAAALPAFQTQITRDFFPVWGLDATLVLDPAAGGPASPVYDATLVVCDDADQAGALGYHDLGSNGEPIGKVFAKTTKDFGGLWTVTFSHEMLEMIADALINLTALDDRTARFYAYEACDAVEDDSLGYAINGITVSDFVTPEWFNEHAVTGTPTSFRKNVRGAFQLAPGGYISYFHGGGWRQITARSETSGIGTAKTHDSLARPGSRRERRVRGRSNWMRST